jgi:hypothetical protein
VFDLELTHHLSTSQHNITYRYVSIMTCDLWKMEYIYEE